MQGLPRDLPVMQVYDPRREGVPGRPAAGGRRRQRARRDRPAGDGGASRSSSARAAASGQMGERARRRRQRVASGPPGSRSRSRARAPTTQSNRALDLLRERLIPSTIGTVRRRAGARHGDDRGLARLQRLDEVARAARVRVRARARVRAAAGHVPLDRDPDQGDRAEPALGRRVLRRARARLPGRPAGVAARLPLDRRRHGVAAAVPVRRPVRPVDGLPRADPQPRARGLRRRHDDRAGGRARHPRDGERRHERGDRDGRACSRSSPRSG